MNVFRNALSRLISSCFVLFAIILFGGCSQATKSDSSNAEDDSSTTRSPTEKNQDALSSDNHGAAILCYHVIAEKPESAWAISIDNFEEQMRYLADNDYTALSLADMKSWLHGEKQIPPQSVLLTFDDWHRSHYDIVVPILEKYALTGTFFVISNRLNPSTDIPKLKELINKGFSIGSHSANHRALTMLSAKQASVEIKQSKIDLERQLGIDIEFFCYPFGYFDKRVTALLEDSGYVGGVTTIPGLNHPATQPFKLRRILIENRMTLANVLGLMRNDKNYYIQIYNLLSNGYVNQGIYEPAEVILEELQKIARDEPVTKNLMKRLETARKK